MEDNEDDIVDQEYEDEESEKKLTKSKPKKPRSEKQKMAFQQVMEKRKKNIEQRKEEKLIEASKLLVKNATKNIIKKEIKPKKEIVQQESKSKSESESERETEEEIIIVKAKPKLEKKKKVKKIIIEESSDDETSIESDGSKEYNKKTYSKSKRHNDMNHLTIQRTEERPKPVFNSANFFI